MNMNLITLILVVLAPAATTALQGVSVPKPKTSSFQRSAVAIEPQHFTFANPGSVPTSLAFPEDSDYRFPSLLEHQPVYVPGRPQDAAKEEPTTLTTELFGEAFGTFWIVGLGSLASMAATFSDPFSSTPLAEIALVWSTVVAASIGLCSSQNWGQAHFNPAMTLASALFRGFEWNKVLPYSLAQLTGSTLGSAAAYSVFANQIAEFEEQQGLVHSSCIDTARVFGDYFDPACLSTAQAFGVEALGTAIIAATAFAITHPSLANKNLPPVPLVMGGTVFTLINWLAPFTQAGMNPARDLGPRLVAYAAGWTDVAFDESWLYAVAPLVGASVGAALVDKVVMSFWNEKEKQL